MKINAIVASNAEHYYHTMVTNDNESWNIRDRHMVEALHHIGQFYGPPQKELFGNITPISVMPVRLIWLLRGWSMSVN